MNAARRAGTALLGLLAGCASVAPPSSPVHAPAAADPSALRAQVVAAETAFAASMAQRDAAAFQRWLADDAVFVGGATVLRGKAAVAARWQRFFETPAAPFSWRPEVVEVQDGGALALSSGPVFDADGKPAGRFFSIWRRDAPGAWRIVFDAGCDCH